MLATMANIPRVDDGAERAATFSRHPTVVNRIGAVVASCSKALARTNEQPRFQACRTPVGDVDVATSGWLGTSPGR